MTNVLVVVTYFVSFILGFLAKKNKWINSKLIPLQNLIIGIICALIELLITKDFSIAIAMSGLMAGGTYDIFKNISELFYKEEKLSD